MLAILGPDRHMPKPVTRSLLPAENFCKAAKEAEMKIPQLSADLIGKYVAGLRHHGLL